MKNLLFISFLLFNLTTIGQAVIEVTNTSNFPRNEEVVEISFSKLLNAFPKIDTVNFVVIDQQTKKQVPYQWELLGMSSIRNLLIQVSVEAKSTKQFIVQKGEKQHFASKTYARYVPERKDDFAWENDKIAFRMYGKELEKTPSEMGYGTDVWVKRTNNLVINGWYKRDDYHSDNGEGLDYYKVGLTLGSGDIAPYIGDTIHFSKNYRQWKILDNGPLRSTFRLSYEEWQLPDQKVNCVKTITIDAGSQLNKVIVEYELSKKNSIPVAVGIVKRTKPGVEFFDEKDGIMGYWEPDDLKAGTTGVGCLFLEPLQRMLMNEKHLLTVTSANNNKPLVYYNGAAWDKAGKITSARVWFDYLRNFMQRIREPLEIRVSKM